MKKRYRIVVLLFGIFLLTGCNNEPDRGATYNPDRNPGVPSTEEQVLNCTRSATGVGDFTAETSISVFYVGSFITRIHTTLEITTSDRNRLNQERITREQLFGRFDDLDYYTVSINQRGNTLTVETIIDYLNVDTDRLLELEGESHNIIRDGRAVLSEWRELARKAGISCN